MTSSLAGMSATSKTSARSAAVPPCRLAYASRLAIVRATAAAIGSEVPERGMLEHEPGRELRERGRISHLLFEPEPAS